MQADGGRVPASGYFSALGQGISVEQIVASTHFCKGQFSSPG